jgi:hypothetical protein
VISLDQQQQQNIDMAHVLTTAKYSQQAMLKRWFAGHALPFDHLLQKDSTF